MSQRARQLRSSRARRPPSPVLRPSASATRRVRARLARRIHRAAPGVRSSRCSNRSPPCTASCTRRPTWRCCSAPTTSPRTSTRARSASPAIPYITHPLAVATILAELGMDTTTLVAALLHDTVEDTDYSLEQLARRLRRGGRPPRRRRHEARQGQARRRRPRPRPSARWSSRWPGTRGCWSSSSPTGCTTCARCGSSRRRSRRRRRARPSRSSPRWHTGWGWRRSSGSWRTSRSRSCTRRSTTRSSGWSPTGRPSRDTYLRR